MSSNVNMFLSTVLLTQGEVVPVLINYVVCHEGM
jgi:hypothetical protein